MFFQAFGFVITLITRLFTFVFGIQLSDNLTFGGVISGLIIASFAYSLIKQFTGVSYINIHNSNIKKRQQGGGE